MAIRVNPKLIDNLERFGAEDVRMCYHCGDCSAVCPHSNETFRFPLLWSVFATMPARSGAGRNDDEPAPVADLCV
jgi:ferredoxin